MQKAVHDTHQGKFVGGTMNFQYCYPASNYGSSDDTDKETGASWFFLRKRLVMGKTKKILSNVWDGKQRVALDVWVVCIASFLDLNGEEKFKMSIPATDKTSQHFGNVWKLWMKSWLQEPHERRCNTVVRRPWPYSKHVIQRVGISHDMYRTQNCSAWVESRN